MNLDDLYAPSTVEKEYRRTCEHMQYVRAWWDEVSNIKELLQNGQVEQAQSVYQDLPESVQIGLWRATRKGSCWTVEERRLLKFGEAG